MKTGRSPSSTGFMAANRALNGVVSSCSRARFHAAASSKKALISAILSALRAHVVPCALVGRPVRLRACVVRRGWGVAGLAVGLVGVRFSDWAPHAWDGHAFVAAGAEEREHVVDEYCEEDARGRLAL